MELNVKKQQKNNFGGYMYRSCEDILEALKPFLKKYECFISLSDEIVHLQSSVAPTVIQMLDAKGNTVHKISGGDRFYVKVSACLKDSSGSSDIVTAYAREEDDKKGMDGSQITGASSSYARKYALNGLFGIDDNKDSDKMNDVKPPKASGSKAPTVDKLMAMIQACQNKVTLTTWEAKIKSSKDYNESEKSELINAVMIQYDELNTQQ